MRRSTLLVLCLLIAAHAVARERITGAPWVRRAESVNEFTAATEATLAETGIRPIVLIETNYYTFLPGEPLQVRMTIDPNGYTAPATLYLYWENRTTGERRYYNLAAKALLAAGQQSDLFGAVGAPTPIVVPKLSDFVLFGTAADATNSFGVNGAIGGSIPTPTGQNGLFQYVLELRDAAGKRVLSRSNAMYSYIESSVNVSGTITSSQTWTANKRYVLNDFVG
ncbi:MAG TPA: hypothetical protein VN181_08545, partial [Thermoanaerobaculia bacterium]|nr:hypothetical protein [Thermoanaerobaculia bacterium]